MKRVTVNASTTYMIHIGEGLLSSAGEIVKKSAGGERAILITDTNVDKFHSHKATASLQAQGYQVFKYVIPAGEASKTFDTLCKILSFMASCHLSRKDVAVALGGGVVGDITGFAAAVYMRGIKFVQIPTTILAAVDSSVGGKTAVDLPEGKNLAGAFYQPSSVICDTDTFSTLPVRDYNNGFGEVIKYAMVADSNILKMLDSPLEDLICQCVKIKASIVAEDEFESGKRQILNFGHSIGHAYEKLSDYSLLHGEAISCGMIAICKIAMKMGLCTEDTFAALAEALARFNLPVEAAYPVGRVLQVMKVDKKASGSSINLVLPLSVGDVVIKPVLFEDIEKLLES